MFQHSHTLHIEPNAKMAPCSKILQIMDMKIANLQSERDSLYQAVDSYLKKVILCSKGLLTKQEATDSQCFQISMEIERSLVFVAQKVQEVKDTEETFVNIDLHSSLLEATEQSTDTVTSPVTALQTQTSLQSACCVTEEQNHLEKSMKMISELQADMKKLKAKTKKKTNQVTVNTNLRQLDDKLMKTDIIPFRTKNELSEAFDNISKHNERLSILEEKLSRLQSESNLGNGKIEDQWTEFVFWKDEARNKLEELQMRLQGTESRLKCWEETFVGRMQQWEDGIERRLQQLEANGVIQKENLRQSNEEGNLTSETVEKRIQELEETILEQREMISNVQSSLARAMETVSIMEKRELVAFTATIPQRTFWPDPSVTLKIPRTIIEFTEVSSNIGDSYNTLTGMMTAPVDGVYLVSLTQRQLRRGFITLHVIQRYNSPLANQDSEKIVCQTRTNFTQTSCSSICLINMNMNDQIFVRAYSAHDDDVLFTLFASFSCFLIH